MLLFLNVAPVRDYDAYCFNVETDAETWSDASTKCSQDNGQLVMVRNKQDRDHVLDLL